MSAQTFIQNMKLKRSGQFHNCPTQFKDVYLLMQHRRANHYKGHIRKQFYRSRPLNLKTDKFSLAMDKLARLLESIYTFQEQPNSTYVSMT